MQYVLAFIYAMDKNLEKAIRSLNEYPGDKPQIVYDKLNELADE